jgi:superfamily II DNA or RNA helicase
MINITIDSRITVSGLPEPIRDEAIKDLTLPNPEYVTKEKLGKWLGGVERVICLAERDNGAFILPRGYLTRLLDRINDAGFEYHINYRRDFLPKVDIAFRGELRRYQWEALYAMAGHDCGVLVSPCGSGKTALGCALIADKKQPALILVHTRQLAEQTREAVKQWLGVDAGMIGDGTFDVRRVSVGLVQSLAGSKDRVDKIRDNFGLVLLDEAHHCPATTFMDVLQQFPAGYRYGLTATPQRRDGLGPFVEAVIGPIRHTITNRELREAGVLVLPSVEWVRSEFRHDGDDWVELISKLTEDETRNRLIFNVIERLIRDGRQIIALGERVKHAECLARAINMGRPGTAEVITGSMSGKKREAAFARVKSGEARVMFSTKLADEGLDAPNLDALVLLTPSRSAGRTIQRAGRVLRSVDGKRQPVIVDIVDANVGLLRSQAKTRFFEAYRTLAPDCRLPEWLETKKRRSE